MTDVINELEPLFREALDDDGMVLRLDLRPEEVGAWDSLAQVRLVVSIEEHFQILFSVDEVEPPETVAQLVAIIEAKLS